MNSRGRRRSVAAIGCQQSLLENVFENPLTVRDEIHGNQRRLACDKTSESFEILSGQEARRGDVGDHAARHRPANSEIREDAILIGMAVEAPSVLLAHLGGQADAPVR